MVRRSRKSLPLISLLMFGLLAGIAFFLYDNLRNRDDSAAQSPTEIATQANTAPTQFPTVEPTFALPQADLVDAAILIPAAGVSAHIVQVYLDGVSWDVTSLGMNVGHLQGTAWLEDAGNIALSGHVELSDGRPGVFAAIDELKVGDLVVLQQGESERRYVVTEVKTVKPDDLTPLYPSIEEKLTLITCGNYDFFQDTYLERIVVVAQRII